MSNDSEPLTMLIGRLRLTNNPSGDDGDADLVYEEEWAAEVERRQAEVESGEARFLSGPETLAKLKSEFQ